MELDKNIEFQLISRKEEIAIKWGHTAIKFGFEKEIDMVLYEIEFFHPLRDKKIVNLVTKLKEDDHNYYEDNLMKWLSLL